MAKAKTSRVRAAAKQAMTALKLRPRQCEFSVLDGMAPILVLVQEVCSTNCFENAVKNLLSQAVRECPCKDDLNKHTSFHRTC